MSMKEFFKRKYHWNNDFRNVRWNKHNATHFFGNFIAGFTGTTWITYAYYLWELWDGKKKSYLRAPTGKGIKNWFSRNFFHADGFSFQDAFIWNPCGFTAGSMLRYALLYYGVNLSFF